MAKQEQITVDKRPAKGKSGLWVLRDSKSGKLTTVRSKPVSTRSIDKASKGNARLLKRLAKR